MFTNNILQLLLAIVVFTTEASAADCVVEWDDGNVVATQLEGSWVMNKELSLVLSPWSDTIVIDEIKYELYIFILNKMYLMLFPTKVLEK